ncbi:MAG TPA: CrcB family protein, partial [Vicinamibacterales bacterium]|nr:CrcB family protein [Vicinamibacterales bacterium]
MRYVMIAVGGALGSIARYQVALLVQTRVPTGFPWGTFVVNFSACLIMGIANTLITDRLVPSPYWRF